jgi:hypothetical protein
MVFLAAAVDILRRFMTPTEWYVINLIFCAALVVACWVGHDRLVWTLFFVLALWTVGGFVWLLYSFNTLAS